MWTEKDLLSHFILQEEGEGLEIPSDDPDDAELSGEGDDNNDDEDEDEDDDWEKEG